MLYFINLTSLFLLIIIFSKLAKKFKILDIPSKRKNHKGKIPLIGGICIFLNLIIFSKFLKLTEDFLLVFYSCIALVVLGALDDIIELGYKFRLFSQLTISLILCGSGLYIVNLGDYGFGNINLGVFSIFVTIVCVVGLTNSFNFIDGIDGLCGGIFLISLSSFLLFIFLLDQDIFNLNSTFFIIMFLNVLLFIFFNLTSYNKIFLGDAGSTSLGFLMSWILILFSQNPLLDFHPILTVWCVTLPIYDLIAVVIKRSYNGYSPFYPDKTHIHFLLINLTKNKFMILLIILSISMLLNLIGFLIFLFFGALSSLLMFIFLFPLYLYFSIRLELKSKNAV